MPPPRARPLAAASALFAMLAFVSLAAAAVCYHAGPLPSKTGAPSVAGSDPEPNCTECHVTFGETGQIPNLNTPGGAIRIFDLPHSYRPGNTYAVRVQLDSDSTRTLADRRWGFQLTAVAAATGAGAGSFVVPSVDSLQIVAGAPGDPDNHWPTRTYVEHTADGLHQGEAGPVEWRFLWKAPVSPAGAVLFFAAGNASNSSLDASGDYIYTVSDTVADTTTATANISWGRLKSRYR